MSTATVEKVGNQVEGFKDGLAPGIQVMQKNGFSAEEIIDAIRDATFDLMHNDFEPLTITDQQGE